MKGWNDAVGPSLAAHAQPLSLRGTTLVVAVDAPAYVTQLRLMTPQLLARLADLAGSGAVEAVDIRVSGLRDEARAVKQRPMMSPTVTPVW